MIKNLNIRDFNGKIMADYYTSATRFKNIVTKELKD
jgi:hypothetical protein